MGMAKLNVWISNPDDPCTTYDGFCFVSIYDCNGNTLKWKGKSYSFLYAFNAHLEVDVPPGCYHITAFQLYLYKKDMTITTDTAIVQAKCNEDTCVKLFAPKITYTLPRVIWSLKLMAKHKIIKPELANPAIEAIEAILKQLPKPDKAFELETFDDYEEQVNKYEKDSKKKK